MADTAYVETSPLGSADAGDLEDFVQEVKRNFRMRLQQGGKRFTGFDTDVPTTVEQHDGKMAVGWENQVNRDDTGYATLLWNHAGSVERIRSYGSGHSTKPDLTEFPGDIGPLEAETISFRGVAFGAHARASFSDPLPVTGYLKRIVFKASDAAGAPNRTLTKIKLIAGTRPSTASLVLTLRKRTVAQQTSTNDPFIDANTTAITGATATLTVASGAYTIEVTLGSPETLAPGEELVAVWGTVGAAADVTVLLQIE